MTDYIFKFRVSLTNAVYYFWGVTVGALFYGTTAKARVVGVLSALIALSLSALAAWRRHTVQETKP